MASSAAALGLVLASLSGRSSLGLKPEATSEWTSEQEDSEGHRVATEAKGLVGIFTGNRNTNVSSVRYKDLVNDYIFLLFTWQKFPKERERERERRLDVSPEFWLSSVFLWLCGTSKMSRF